LTPVDARRIFSTAPAIGTRADRQDPFVQEAIAASALNHPKYSEVALMLRKSFLICVVAALQGTGCGGSHDAAAPPLAPTSVDVSLRPPTALTVTGRKSFSVVGETSQLTAIATWPDGNARDVTPDVRWNSHDPSVATISSSGIATAVGFGVARIDAAYGSLNSTHHVSVTPAGTFAVTGEVREPGQGALGEVRVFEPVSGRSTLTDQTGNYTLLALASTHLRFEKDGYEPGELDIAPDTAGYMRMQRIVRITTGETAVVPKLTHMDVSYDVGPDRCSPCRLIRIIARTRGIVHFELAWEPNQGPELHLWAGGERFVGDGRERRLVADAAVSAGENVVYVGYYRWTIIYGSSIKFTLATSTND